MSKGVNFLNEVENHAEFSQPGQPLVAKLFDITDAMRSFEGNSGRSLGRS